MVNKKPFLKACKFAGKLHVCWECSWPAWRDQNIKEWFTKSNGFTWWATCITRGSVSYTFSFSLFQNPQAVLSSVGRSEPRCFNPDLNAVFHTVQMTFSLRCLFSSAFLGINIFIKPLSVLLKRTKVPNSFSLPLAWPFQIDNQNSFWIFEEGMNSTNIIIRRSRHTRFTDVFT